jgi:hypothetical protein
MRWRDDDDRDDTDLQDLYTSENGEEGDDEDTVPCPHCRRRIYEDSERCPYCANYLSREEDETALGQKSWWLILGVLVCLVIAAGWIVGW